MAQFFKEPPLSKVSPESVPFQAEVGSCLVNMHKSCSVETVLNLSLS